MNYDTLINAVHETIWYDEYMKNVFGGRSINLPQELTENLAIQIIRVVEGTNMKWCKTAQPPIPGDMYLDGYCQVTYTCDRVIITPIRQLNELKFFSSTGPCSFGPTERWNVIYFLDGLEYRNFNFKLYKVSLANDSDEWKQLRVSRTQTFEDQASTGRRPRLPFSEIKNQLGEHCQLIWEGDIRHLCN
jgi:hypothetical protein